MRSPLQKYDFCGQTFYIKRDDLLGEYFNGNKFRKFYSLLRADLAGKILVSYGGNQSNAMVCLALLAKDKGARFVYVTPQLSSYLDKNVDGNFSVAIKNGMEVVHTQDCRVDSLREEALSISERLNGIFISQGGDYELSKEGIDILATELNMDIREYGLKNPIVFYTAGSGISSLLLHQSVLDMGLDFEVCAIGCVGDEEYLKKQFNSYSFVSHPKIISKKIKFASLHKKILDIYHLWLDKGLEFDLIYDCVGWWAIEDNILEFTNRDKVFIHSGGTLGNKTQLDRYAFRAL